MPTGIQIGPLFVHFYGVIIMLGALVAAWLSSQEAKRRGENTEFIWDVLPWVLIAGIIGARIWHILTPNASNQAQGLTTEYYLTHPLDMLAIWNGGLGIPGAVFGGALALWYYTHRRGESFWTWTDIVAPGLALAQAIGRWGNFINQELYGAPTNLPWAIFIEEPYRLQGFENIAYYHPLFLYESIWNLINMAVLLFVGRRYKGWLKPGDIFLGYLVIYPFGRFLLEYLRLDPSPVAGINANQALMLAIFVGALAMLIIRHRPGATKEEVIEQNHSI
jgi:phosphatidylglycerol:prolipoprotein diacylglycerol transferase